MTVNTTASKVTQQGNGGATVWPYAFEIPGATSTDQTNVRVTILDTTVTPNVSTVLANNAYSITGINNSAGGNVTYPLSGSPIAAGVSITIERNVPYVQSTDFPNQSAFLGSVVTNTFDYCMMCIQQLVTRLAYTLNFPLTDATPPVTLPGAAARANTYLGFDGNGVTALFSATPGGGGSTTPSWTTRTVYATGAISVNDAVVRADCTSGNQALTLPAVASVLGKLLVFKKVDATANWVTISGDANIDGMANFVLPQRYNTVCVQSNGITWDILFAF